MICHYWGPVGSGKTYLCVLKAIDALEAGKDIATVNFHLKRQKLEDLLVDRGMLRSVAHERVMRIRHVVNEEQFRSLRGSKNRWVDVFIDEASTWFPSHRNYDSFLDQTAVAMSRHNYLHLHVVSQFTRQVHTDIASHAEEVWRCYPMRFAPVPQILALVSLYRVLWGLHPIPILFMYVRGIASDGRQTYDMVKSEKTNKRRIPLNPIIAEVYATDEHLSNPVADRMGRKASLEMQRQILAGTYLPSSPCPQCHGAREVDMVWMLRGLERVKEFATRENLSHQDLISEAGTEPCGYCINSEGTPQGYYYPTDHPDIEAANKNAHMFTADYGRQRR